MSETHQPNNQADAVPDARQAQTNLPLGVVVARLPHAMFSSGFFINSIFIGIRAGVILTSSIGVFGTRSPLFGLFLMTNLGVGLIIGNAFMYRSYRKADRKMREPEREDAQASAHQIDATWQKILTASAPYWLAPQLGRAAKWDWHRLQGACREYGGEIPRAVMDRAAVQSISNTATTENMLEIEPIGMSAGFDRRVHLPILIGMMFMILGVALSPFSTNTVLSLVGFSVVVGSLLLSFRPIRDRIPQFSRKTTEPIAGPGFVENYRGKRWYIGDAVMLLTCRDDGRNIMAMLVGPAGRQLFNFADANDPEFIKLWQRWMHPHPRFELLDENT